MGMVWKRSISHAEMGKKCLVLVFLLCTVICLCGCSGNTEKVNVLKGEYSNIVSEYNELINIYADKESNTYDEAMNELGEKIKLIGENDLSDISDDIYDNILNELNSCLTQINGLYKEIDSMGETGQSSFFLSATIKNQTTISFHELYFYPAGEEEKKVNLLENQMEILDGNGIFNIINIEADKDNTIWHLESYDEEGNIIASEDIDLSGYNGKNAVITLKFNFDEMECWMELASD